MALRLMPVSVDVPRRTLGLYAPALGDAAAALETIVQRAAAATAPTLLARAGVGAAPELELRTVFSRLEPDTPERPASVAVVVDVIRRSSRQPVYTRQVESEVRRLIQEPVPMDDPRFERTALGRATASCVRSLLTALADAFSSG